MAHVTTTLSYDVTHGRQSAIWVEGYEAVVFHINDTGGTVHEVVIGVEELRDVCDVIETINGLIERAKSR